MVKQGEYGQSTHGERTFILNGYEYCKHRQTVEGHVVWRCRLARTLKCKANLLADGLKVVRQNNEEHNHEANIATALARKAVGEMKKKTTEVLAGPSAIQTSIAATLAPHILMALPKRLSLNRQLRRHKQKLRDSGMDDEIALPPCPTDLDFDIPPRFADIVLYDSGSGADRLLLLGCPELLPGFSRSSTWLADGTFKVVPSLFFQLYSIHFQFVEGISPAAIYCLLPNKTRLIYDRVLEEVKRLVPEAAPDVIITDFETNAMSAFGDAFPSARVTGCYFHLCQSVLRKVNEIGMKVEYETRDEVRGYVRCLAALSHVPAANVVEAFDVLADDPPDTEHIDELLSYFEHTYVRGRRQRGRGNNFGPPLFSIDIWNQRHSAADGLARTTNLVEGWHYGLQALFQCSHPTLWRFLDGLRLDSIKQKTLYLQGVSGLVQPGQKRYRLLKERVVRAIATYDQTDILTFLRAIAFLSHN